MKTKRKGMWFLAAGTIAALAYALVRDPRAPSPPPEAPPARSAVAQGFSVAWSGVGAAETRPEPGEISVLTLLPDMTDLAHLARRSDVTARAGLVSSTDRRARGPGDGSWFANDDFVTAQLSNLVRVEGPETRRRYVLADLDGPGAVLRLWTAAPAGTVRVYIDGAPEPALEAPMGALLSGEVTPFQPPFAQVTSMGATLYFPIPFRRHCTITTDSIVSVDPFTRRPVDRLYYQVGYVQFDPAAAPRVRSYAGSELERARALLEQTRSLLAGPSPADEPVRTPRLSVTAIPRQTVERGHSLALGLTAPSPAGGAISSLRLRTSERDPIKLAATTLVLSFDGEETVRVPLTSLFGTGPGLNAFATWPVAIDGDGQMRSAFVMPFHAEARLAIVHEAEGAIDLEGEVGVEPWAFDDKSLVFHARRRGPESLPTRPYRDWTVGDLVGPGQVVGVVLDVDNPPGVNWWGEGDEKIYVDGERFPSWFGTGTEDYFGFAWSSTDRFAHPYHAQTAAPEPGRGFAGHFSMSRFHVLDPIPFTASLRFDLELWHWSETTVDLAATIYWYARPGRGGSTH